MPQTLDLDRALLDPTDVFRSPEEVADHPTLEVGQKLEILRRWEYDEAEREVAEEEGMGGGHASLTHRVAAAIQRVTGEAPDASHSPPTKQRGL